MKIFISHKREDQVTAGLIAKRLRERHRVDSYLDVFDPHSSKAGDDLAEYIRARMEACTELMAVVSEKTKDSWWVPWEIGVATEKDYAISTYAAGNCRVPIYLQKWPYLKSYDELDTYVRVASRVQRETLPDRYSKAASVRRSYAQRFHEGLKTALGQ